MVVNAFKKQLQLRKLKLLSVGHVGRLAGHQNQTRDMSSSQYRMDRHGCSIGLAVAGHQNQTHLSRGMSSQYFDDNSNERVVSFSVPVVEDKDEIEHATCGFSPAFEHGKKGEQLLFPWRGKYEDTAEYKSKYSVLSLPPSTSYCPMFATKENDKHTSFYERFICSIRGKISQMLIYHFFVTAQTGESYMLNTPHAYDYMDPRGGGLIIGAQQAFISCSNAIFKVQPAPVVEEEGVDSVISDTERIQLELMQKGGDVDDRKEKKYLEKLHKEAIELKKYKESKRANRTYSPPLMDMVDKRMAGFFDEAFQRLPPPLVAHYDLHSTRLPNITYSDMLLGACR